ncbi:hypothetical protein FQZ97_822920 [compost metagenome]
MHHLADVAFVDAHAEGDGGDHDVDLAGHELALQGFPRLVGHAGVVGAGGDATLAQALGDLFGSLLQGHVDDGRLSGARRQPVHQAAQLVVAGHRLDQQVEVAAVETGGDHIGIGDDELALHVGDHRRRRGGGQQQHLGNAELALVLGQLEVVGTEVVAPFGDAVRLVHHQQGNRHLLDKAAEALVLQALHRDHQDLQLAGARPGHDLGGRLAALRRVDAGGGDAMAMEEGELVLHQRQQRRHHQGQVRQVQGRQLVAQGLAGTGGEDGGGRSAGQYRGDGGFLARAETVVAKDLGEAGGGHAECSVDRADDFRSWRAGRGENCLADQSECSVARMKSGE